MNYKNTEFIVSYATQYGPVCFVTRHGGGYTCKEFKKVLCHLN